MNKPAQRILLFLCCLAAFWVGVACRLSFTDNPTDAALQKQKDYYWPLVREKALNDFKRIEKGE